MPPIKTKSIVRLGWKPVLSKTSKHLYECRISLKRTLGDIHLLTKLATWDAVPQPNRSQCRQTLDELT
jgi:hypothetical protein